MIQSNLQEEISTKYSKRVKISRVLLMSKEELFTS
jgi:hypothetical protein